MGIFNNERGVSIIAAAVTLAILSLFGLVVNYTLVHNSSLVTNAVQYDEAFYITQAGIEYGLKKVGMGQSPVVNPPGLTFGNGSFTIGQSGSLMTVTGTVGTRTSIHTVQIVTQADCAALDVEDAEWKNGQNLIQHVTVEKECSELSQIVIDKVIVEWTLPQSSEHLTNIKIENTNNSFLPTGIQSGGLAELVDEAITGGGRAIFNEIGFDTDLRGRTFTLTVVMADESMLTGTFLPED
ncbi:MAG: pilus assembly PilX N-terminal domain-containing protein [Deltaproteobacteria bacterium]|nr:pilus assembly PilX N-terminal domain-containing protein [Deltaproteobacteria bacterium]